MIDSFNGVDFIDQLLFKAHELPRYFSLLHLWETQFCFACQIPEGQWPQPLQMTLVITREIAITASVSLCVRVQLLSFKSMQENTDD